MPSMPQRIWAFTNHRGSVRLKQGTLMQVDSIDVGQNDDHSWYINLYGKDDEGSTRRETFADNLTEREARQLASPLRKHAEKLLV